MTVSTEPTMDVRTSTSGVARVSRPLAARAAALALAGVAFATYPAIRGYGLEIGLAGAELWARPAWLAAHVLGMAGFVLAGWGLAAVDRRAGRWGLLGAVLVLPYYGAEAFGLHALGRRATETGDASMAAAADMFRYGPVALTVFALGLTLVAAAGLRLLVLVPRATAVSRVGLSLVGLALATYLPQFFATPTGRVVHGAVLGVGLVVLAATVLVRRARSARA